MGLEEGLMLGFRRGVERLSPSHPLSLSSLLFSSLPFSSLLFSSLLVSSLLFSSLYMCRGGMVYALGLTAVGLQGRSRPRAPSSARLLGSSEV